MTDISAGLLPEGFRDRLPPQAEAAANLLRRLLDSVAAHGYERVSPPLIEFEQSLVTRLSSAKPQDLLRFVDPISSRTLAFRPDITPQIGRIATTRMAHVLRPLRLAYGGQVARVKGTQLNPDRESLQAGAELIGTDSVAAVIEVLRLALDALADLGLGQLSVDLTMPGLIADLAAGAWPLDNGELSAVENMLDGKDIAGLRAVGGGRYEPLILAAGPADAAVARLRALDLGTAINQRLDDIAALAAAVAGRASVTLDPTERHSFGYQSWVGFSIYAPAVRGELGRGGAYAIVHPDNSTESAVGFSLYVDGLVDAGLGEVRHNRILLPLGTAEQVGRDLRAQGWITVNALEGASDPVSLRCTHIWNGAPSAVA